MYDDAFKNLLAQTMRVRGEPLCYVFHEYDIPDDLEDNSWLILLDMPGSKILISWKMDGAPIMPDMIIAMVVGNLTSILLLHWLMSTA